MEGSPPEPDKDELSRVIDIWKYVVSVQMHFNDMGMRIRNLYFTILAAAMGLIGVVQGKRIEFHNPNISVSLTLFVFSALIPISMLFYFMDRHWYHRLLVGSVNQCMEIEAKYQKFLPEIQLGSKISAASPVEFRGLIWRFVFFFVRDSRFRKGSKLHSDAKIEILYKTVIWAFVLLIVVYAFTGGIRMGGCGILPIASNIACWKTATALSPQPTLPAATPAVGQGNGTISLPSESTPQKGSAN